MNLEKVTQKFEIEMSGGTKRYVMSAKQGDRATRYAEITLLSDGEPYNIPEGAIVTAFVRKPDRKKVYTECSFSGAVVTVELTSQTLAAAGTARCEIEAKSADQEQVITSVTFEIEIEPKVKDENAITSTNEMTVLEKTLQQYAKAEESRISAENIRTQNETERITAETERASAESTRAQNEAKRVSAEAERASAENARTQAESERTSAEDARAQAESERTSAEDARAQAETARATAEDERAQAEESRISAENIRSQNETERIAAETERASAESTRAQAEESRVSTENTRTQAEKSRISAENAREQAEGQRQQNAKEVLKKANNAIEVAGQINEASHILDADSGTKYAYTIYAQDGKPHMALTKIMEG